MRWRLTLVLVLLGPAFSLADEPHLACVERNPDPGFQASLAKEDVDRVRRAILRLALRSSPALWPSPTEPGLFVPAIDAALASVANATPEVRVGVANALQALAEASWPGLLNPNDPAELYDFTDRFGSAPQAAEALGRLGDELWERGRCWEADRAWLRAETITTDATMQARLRAKRLQTLLDQGRDLDFLANWARLRHDPAVMLATRAPLRPPPRRAAPDDAASSMLREGLLDPVAHLQPSGDLELPAGVEHVFPLARRVLLADGNALAARSRTDGTTAVWWRGSPGADAPRPFFALTGQHVIVCDRTRLACLSVAADGRKLWEVRPPSAHSWQAFASGAPVVAHGVAVVGLKGSVDGREHLGLAAHDLANGKVLWRKSWADWPHGEQVPDVRLAAQGRAVLALAANAIAAFDGDSGKPLWARTWKQPDRAPPPLVAHHDGWLALASTHREVIEVVDAHTGRLAWSQPVAQPTWLAATSDGLVVASAVGLRAHHWLDGSTRWEAPGVEGEAAARGAVLGNVLWLHGEKGHWVIDLATGRLLADPAWLDHVPPGRPLWQDGQLWIRADTRLIAIGRPQRESE